MSTLATPKPPTALAEAREEAELAVLGGLLLANRFDLPELVAAVRAQLAPADLSAPELVACLTAIYEQTAAGEPMDSNSVRLRAAVLCPAGDVTAAVSAALDAGAEVTHLDAVVTTATALRAQANARRLSGVLLREARALSDGRQTAEQTAARVAEIALAVGTPAGPGFVPLTRVTDATMKLLQEREAGGGVGPRDVLSGFALTDERLNGFRPGHLIVLAGVPGSGKTAGGLQIALNAGRRGTGVGIVTAEMPGTDLVGRLLCNEGRIATGRLQSMQLDAGEARRLVDARRRLDALPIEIDDEAEPELRDVLARCRALKARVPSLGLVVVDFLQLLTGQEGDGQPEHLKRVSYGLKGLAKRLDVPVIALAQVNDKDVEKRPGCRPGLNDLQGSSGIRQAADLVGFFYRASMYQPLGLDEPDTIELSWPKARNVAPFSEYLQADLQYMRIGPQPIPPELSPRVAARQTEALASYDPSHRSETTTP